MSHIYYTVKSYHGALVKTLQFDHTVDNGYRTRFNHVEDYVFKAMTATDNYEIQVHWIETSEETGEIIRDYIYYYEDGHYIGYHDNTTDKYYNQLGEEIQ